MNHKIIYIHGVNTRKHKYDKHNADELDQLIGLHLQDKNLKLSNSLALFWGNVNDQEEENLFARVKLCSVWENLQLKSFREKQVLQFVGDAALYISRMVGKQVVNALHTQIVADQATMGADGYRKTIVHLVAHSWGTVILFDLLFAERWTDQSLDEETRNKVQFIRNIFFGIDPTPEQGTLVGSINTMGSPIALFSLMNKDADGSHSISGNLSKLIEALGRRLNGDQVPWNNFLHPGDLVGWPLEKVLPHILCKAAPIAINDILTEDHLIECWEPISLMSTGQAHGSYWSSTKVAEKIGSTILATEALAAIAAN
ncbi:MAG: hypothetical protein JNN26_20515 [Candidatus Obscuribacter sp.]|nr:hypothetical protein [Candidatus Obscuribacter sp.]